jgi:2',3'-cyclic-nucleotide 2'-phosphodiesterase/3'-nucleotidase
MTKNKTFPILILLCCLLLLPPLALAKDVRIDILTVNDFHGALRQEGKTPGVAKLAGFIKELRGRNPRGTLILSAGDMFQGSVRSNLLYGKPVIEMMNHLNFAAMTLGNHEFDWGINVLRQRAGQAAFPLLAANVLDKATGQPLNFVLPYTIVKVSGVNVGIIGLATPETARTTTMSVAGAHCFLSPAEMLPNIYRQIKNAGAQVVVVLSHLGSAQAGGAATGEAADFISALSGSLCRIDAVVSAHTHNAVKDKIRGIPLVQAGASGQSVGVITLYYSTEKGRVTQSFVDVLPVSADQTPDRKVEKIVARAAKRARPLENSVIGQTQRGLDHDRHTLSPLGLWVTDVMRKVTKADLAVQNGGGLRKPLAPGKITLGSLYEIEPFDNTLVTMQMTGRQIRELLEYGMDNEYNVLVYSGVNIVYDRAAQKGARIASAAFTDGRALLADGAYTVCANSFLADGGDGYVMFKQAKNIINTNIVQRDVLADAVRAADSVEPKDDGRFKETPAERIKPAA